MKKSLAIFATVLAAVLNAATPSTSLVYKNTTTNALTGNIVVGNNTTISATGNGTITATALTGNISGNPTVSGNLTVSGGSIVNGAGTAVYYFGTPSNNYMYYDGSSLYTRVGGSDRLTISGTTGDATFGGNLSVSGTGLSAISGNLSVAGIGTFNKSLDSITTETDYAIRIKTSAEDGGLYLGANSTISAIQAIDPGTTFGRNLAIQSQGGNVLIGTTSNGGQKLQVNGTAYVSGDATFGGTIQANGGTASISHAASAANIVFKATTNAYAEINANSAIGEFSISSGPSAGWGGFFTWKTDTTERMRLTNTGRLRVGQSIDANDARIYAYYPLAASGGNAAIGTEVDQTTALRAIQFANPNGIVGTITTSGSATSFNTSSDRRLKTKIAPAGSASALIDSIQIVEHDWKAGGHVRFGVIAQDVQTVAPEVVFVGDEGEEVKIPWGVDYSKLVPALIKEVQTLRARVAALEAASN